ncbi:MAG: S-layer homology domain-containing protein, partial [Firmicutes bacterium]|nr:S-layer homology domain-containing protein [Bacillota bacterium]
PVTADITLYAKWEENSQGGGSGTGGNGGGGGGSATVEPEPVVPTNPFKDVDEKDYFYDAVMWAVANGVTSGTSADTFSPDATCTRAQTVTFLWNAAGKPEPKSTTCPFTDVAPTAYYYKAVLWAVEEGITSGTSATTFGPEQIVTRGQNVTFLWKFADKPAVEDDSKFADVSEANYYHDAVVWAAEEGITSGTSATTFGPENPCTRAQIVTFLYRHMVEE